MLGEINTLFSAAQCPHRIASSAAGDFSERRLFTDDLIGPVRVSAPSAIADTGERTIAQERGGERIQLTAVRRTNDGADSDRHPMSTVLTLSHRNRKLPVVIIYLLRNRWKRD